MRINYRAVKLYLNGKLKEEKEFSERLVETIDIEQSKEFIDSLEKAIIDTEIEDMVKQWNKLVDELEVIRSKAIRKDYYLGKFFKNKLPY